ncbi:hypothetical protein AHF37_12408 [Paragonimus kellicotti]|nr:hypothetical protein AHF37_12408 [Paragonimus kellicotti]
MFLLVLYDSNHFTALGDITCKLSQELPCETSTTLPAFESLCRYSNIPCRTVKGLAKGVDYTVGMKLTEQPMPPEPGDNSAIGRIQHAWSAAYIDGKWALFDSMWAAERLAMSANARLSQIAQFGRMEYETDMFYFNADPAIFIHSHFPFEPEWQLLDPPLSLQVSLGSKFCSNLTITN